MTAFLAVPVLAVDGVIEINQAKALAGGATPADTPGFPVTIDRSGSYRLTGNLDVTGQPDPQDVTAVRIEAEDVTLDLNGFTILGPTVCTGPSDSEAVTSCMPSGTGTGVEVISEASNTTVVNGTVRGMGGAGIVVRSFSRVENVTARSNGGAGISAGGFSTVCRNRVTANGSSGIATSDGSVVDANSVSRNDGFGISANNGSVVTHNVVSASDAIALLANNAVVAANVAFSNDGAGIAGATSVFVNNISRNNLAGVQASSGSTVLGNVARGNDQDGLTLSADTGYAQNVATDNGSDVDGGIEIGTNLCGADTTCP
jgi:hypothetical protein